MRRVILAMAAALVLGGCSDDDHKGDFSVGPVPSTPTAKETTTRLVYDPQSPIATARVAGIFKRRLAAVEVDGSVVKIAGGTVHVDVPNEQAEKVKKALAGGRADLWLHSPADVFGSLEDPPAGTTLETEKAGLPGGTKAIHFLKAPVAKRAVFDEIGDAAGGAKVLSGIVFEDGKPRAARTFLAQPDRSIRGEFVETAKVEKTDDGLVLAVAFNASGKSFVRWNTKQKERFVFVVDGDAIGTAHLDEEEKSGVLRFSVLGRDEARAKALAATVAGRRAVSHEVVLKETTTPP